ncbi:hypothetical protein BH24GEM1_BH24GEM1_28920 [soil metagenome]
MPLAEQQIRFCTSSDGARIAFATVGDGAPLVKAANWLSHLEFDWNSPVWSHWLRELSRDHTLIRYDSAPRTASTPGWAGSSRSHWGHALAIAAVLALAAAIGLVLPPRRLQWLVAGALFALGIFHLMRHRHFRWGGMRVGSRDLTIWSFLMASAHGAGLMALPFVLGAASHASAHAPDAAHHAGHVPMVPAGMADAQVFWLVASGVHTFGYLAATGVIAVVVYEKLGLRLLRTAWVNLDLVWSGALVASAILTPLL